MVEILRHLQMRFEDWNRLINIDPYLGIARKLALRPAERGKRFLMIADVHVQKSLVELRAFILQSIIVVINIHASE